jgi:hypothetical protein
MQVGVTSMQLAAANISMKADGTGRFSKPGWIWQIATMCSKASRR